MHKRAYISNICHDWPIERQQELLAGIEPVYLDKISPKAIKDKNEAKLLQRADLLRPTSRKSPEQIVVADWPVLAFTWQQFLGVCAQATGRNATLHAVATGQTIDPHGSVEALAAILPSFAERVRGRGLRKSREERARERVEDAQRRAMLVADDYGKPDDECPMDELRARAADKDGKPMAPATLVKYLGKRKDAQRAYQAGLKRSATAAKRKDTP